MALPLPFRRKGGKMKISGTRSAALYQARGRMVIMSALFIMALILIVARVVDLTILQGALVRYADSGEAAEIQAAPAAKVLRADITDRNGVLLATTLETASLYADPTLIAEPEKVAQGLAAALPGLSYGELLQKLQRKGRFVWIKRNLTPQEQHRIMLLGQPGLKFQEEARRIYPQGPLAAHIIGYTDVDGVGLSGIERSFNALLDKGASPLALTIDVRLQHILRRETGSAMERFHGKGAAGIIMDTGTGEVLAAVSLPDFDPHDPGAADPDEIFNRVTLGVYELGSVFKIFSTAALLETRNVGMSAVFDARKPLERSRFTISDYHPEKRFLTVPEVFMLSSNIGSALMGEMVGTKALRNFYSDLGLLDAMPLEIDEVGKPLVPRPWRDINTLTASYGHGIAVTPLQMVAAAASIVNGGLLVRPHFLRGEGAAASAAMETSRNSPDVRIVSPQTAHRIRQLMRLTVTDGTGTHADVPGYRVGGKTGTADKIVNGKYDGKRRMSSFIGIFPVDEPRYAVFIVIDEPQGIKESYGYATGGWVAAPAVGNVIAAMAPLLGMSPVTESAGGDMAASLKQFVHAEGEGVGHASR